MNRSLRLLPMPGAFSGLWIILPVFLGSLAVFLVSLLVIVQNLNDPAIGMVIVYGVFYGGGITFGTGIVLVQRYFQHLRDVEWGQRARAVGLVTIREQVTPADLEPFLDLPLLHVADPGEHRAG